MKTPLLDSLFNNLNTIAEKSQRQRIYKIMDFNIVNATSWLSPRGEFHPISRTHSSGRWSSHSDWAQAHNKKMSDLFDSGWMRVTFIGETLYMSNDSSIIPTNKQKKAVIDFSIESNGRFKHVIYENGQGKETELTESKKLTTFKNFILLDLCH